MTKPTPLMMVMMMMLLLPLFGTNAFSIQGTNTQNPVEQIRDAMKLTTIGQSNITAAHSAVILWNDILQQNEFSMQPASIRILCNSLYASSLSRIGRDRDALDVHDITLSLVDDSVDDNILIDVRISRGEALQRLMRYAEAGNEYLAVCQIGKDLQSIQDKIARSAYGSALCFMRQGDLDGAESILSSLFKGVHDLSGVDSNLVGMYGALLWEIYQRNGQQSEQSKGSFTPAQLLNHAASSPNASPVYKWFHALTSKSKCDMFENDVAAMERDSLLQIAAINQSPFDDAELIHLDDKVLLQDLLYNSGSTSTHWPEGYVLPRDQNKFEEYCTKNTDSQWILKERAGYGSHGNRIATCLEALDVSKQGSSDDSKHCVLCQKLIEPSLLFHERKFSIRVYVVYFSRGENNQSTVYLLNQGLAKLAESVYQGSSSSEEALIQGASRVIISMIFRPQESTWKVNMAMMPLTMCGNQYMIICFRGYESFFSITQSGKILFAIRRCFHHSRK